MGKIAAIGLSLALSITAAAQGRVGVGRPGGGSIAIGMGGHHFGPGIVRGGHAFNRPYRRYGNPYGYGVYGAPYYFSDDYGPSEADYRPEPAPAPVQLVQEKPEPLPDPVLLELRGNRWVKVGNFGDASQQALNVSASAPSAPAKEIPPALLIYRDGRTEEVSSYSIIGGMMYTKSDYYSSGSWTRTIQLADLDLPATVKQNQERGVKFDLPSGPDEVVIRP